MWSFRLPLLFIICPRYLYLSVTSSSISPSLAVFLVFCPPLFVMLLLAFPNSMWYFLVVWFVMSSIFYSSSWDVDINKTSSTHSRQAILVLFSSISIPIGSFWMSLLISSISTPYSSTDSTPPCLMLSFIFIFLVSPYFVAIFAVGFSLSFFIILQCLSFMPCLCITYIIAMPCHRPLLHLGRPCRFFCFISWLFFRVRVI